MHTNLNVNSMTKIIFSCYKIFILFCNTSIAFQCSILGFINYIKIKNTYIFILFLKYAVT